MAGGVAKVNPIAKALRHPLLRQKIVPPKKGKKAYKRKDKHVKKKGENHAVDISC